ncbi:hypothetical protein [Salinicola salarius]|uniref:hypothetical protein n=1 Tax=Salinicola salarius TaxID=430457 RepID=UPI000DA19636|nr:hypothetical protein [Salinicola salarius]
MNAFLFPIGFSSRPKVEQVIERFALIGYARLLLLLEDLASSPSGDSCRRKYVYSALALLLEAPEDVALEFVQALAEFDLVTLEDDGEFVVITTAVVTWPAAAEAPPPLLFTTLAEWSAWMQDELGVPTAQANGEAYARYYRRWIATNVTPDEMTQAVTRAVEQQAGFHPDVLHQQLRAVRAARIREAEQ